MNCKFGILNIKNQMLKDEYFSEFESRGVS